MRQWNAGESNVVVPILPNTSVPAELSRQFGCSVQSITNWIAQAANDAGKPLPGKEGMTAAERQALVRLRRQLRQVQMERDILAKL